MFSWLTKTKQGPIGVDIGADFVALLQCDVERTRLVEYSRWGIEPSPTSEASDDDDRRVVAALHAAREGRKFRGNAAVLCLQEDELFLQNVRVPKTAESVDERLVMQEAAGRIPFPLAEAEIRFLEAAQIRQGESTMHEVIVLACPRPQLERKLRIVEAAGLAPVAVDAEPLALLRTYARQMRRDDDRDGRLLLVHIGPARTAVLIGESGRLLFAKYLPFGGRNFDEAVATSLNMTRHKAATLRRNNGERRGDLQDPEISRSVASAIRPVVEELAGEISLCVRYHSVTFRGKPLVRLVLGGGEASPELAEGLAGRIGLAGQVSDPFRPFDGSPTIAKACAWDVATGLALRELSA